MSDNIGADKLLKIIDSLTFNSRETILGLTKSNLVSSEVPYVDITKNKLDLHDTSGTVVDNSVPIAVNLRIEKWMIHILDKFFEEWKSENYSSSKFDELVFNDNVYELIDSETVIVSYTDITANSKLNKIYNPDTNPDEVSSEATRASREKYKSIYQPLSKSLVRLAQILYGTSENLAFYEIEEDNTITNADYSGFSLSPRTNKDTFIGKVPVSGKDVRELIISYSDFFTDPNVGYWLLTLRNTQNPKYISNSRLIPFETRTPVFDSNMSIDNSLGIENHMYPTAWRKYDTFGHYGDSNQHKMAGYYWRIRSPRVSTGIGTMAQGINSLTGGFYTIAAGNSSSAYNNKTWAIDDCTSTFGVEVHGAAAEPDAFVELEPQVMCTASCTPGETQASLQLSGTNYEYYEGTQVVIFDAYDGNGRRIKSSIEGTVSRVQRRRIITGFASTFPFTFTYGYYTILYIDYNSELEANLRSLSRGKISKKLSQSSAVKSRFYIGQYNDLSDADSDIFQIGTGLSSADKNTFFRVKNLDADTQLDIGSYDERALSVSTTAISSKLNQNKTRNLLIDADYGIYLNHDDAGSVRLYSGYMQFDDASESARMTITDSSFFIKSGFGGAQQSYINSNSGYTTIYAGTNAVISNNASGNDINLSGDYVYLRSRSSAGGIYVGDDDNNTDVNIGAQGIIGIGESVVTFKTPDLTINTTSGSWLGSGQKTIQLETLTINSDLTIGASNAFNFTTFSHNPFTGTNFLFNKTSNPQQITVDGVDKFDNGSHEINQSGFYMMNSESGPAVANAAFVDGTLHNMVPDTTVGNKWNYYMVTSYSDSRRWILGKDFYNGRRVWSNKKSGVGNWSGWRSLSYYDEVSAAGRMIDLKDSFIDDVAKDGASTKFSINTIQADIDPWPRLWGNSQIAYEQGHIRPLIISGSALETGGLGQLAKGGPVGEGGIAEIKSFEVSKVGQTVFFDLTVRVNPYPVDTTTRDKIATERAALADADTKYGYCLMFYMSGDMVPQLTPLYMNEFHEQQPERDRNSRNSVYGVNAADEPNDFSFGSSITHKLLITPYIQDVPGSWRHHGCVFQIHRFDRKEFKFYEQNRTLMRFSGHYFALNADQLSDAV